MTRTNPRWLSLIAALGMVAGVARGQTPSLGAPLPAASAQTSAPNGDLEQRVRELEALVRSLQAQVSTQPKVFSTQSPTQSETPADAAPDYSSESTTAAPGGGSGGGSGGGGSGTAFGGGGGGSSGGGSSPKFGLAEGKVAGWNNGFYIQSPDRQFILRFTGQIQEDYRGFLKSADTTDIDTFLLRRARFGLEANIFNFYEFRFLPDFGQGKAIIQDCYINVHYWDELQFEAGKFKQPVSYEQLIQDRFTPAMERSLIDQMMPARDLGVMVHGQNLFCKRFDYAVSLSNGETNGGTNPPDSDTNNNSDFAARAVVRPFAGDNMPIWLRYAQIGASGTFGIENEPYAPATLRTPATVPWLTFTAGDRANGVRTRFVPEYSYFCGPFGFYTEYLWMQQEMKAAAAKAVTENIPFEGWVLFGSVLLTGETRTGYSEQIKPLAPFDPCRPFHNPGAWELIARVSQLRVSDQIFNAGVSQLANPANFASRATEVTVGFNWYLNDWVRVQLNYEHATFNQPVLLGTTRPAGLLNGQDTIYSRFQIIF